MKDAAHRAFLRGVPEERMAGERLPEHDAHREEIRPLIEPSSAEVLRRRVRDLALEPPRLGHGRAVPRICDAKVGEPREPVHADEDVVRRDVAVHELERLTACIHEPMRRREAGERVGDDSQHHGHRQTIAGVARGGEELREIRAVDVLHHEKVAVRGPAHVERGDYVRVADARGEARLVEEHPHELGVVGEMLVQHLDRDEPLELADAAGASYIHRPHPTHGQEVEHLVARDGAPDERIAGRIDAAGHRVEDTCPPMSTPEPRGRGKLWECSPSGF